VILHVVEAGDFPRSLPPEPSRLFAQAAKLQRCSSGDYVVLDRPQIVQSTDVQGPGIAKSSEHHSIGSLHGRATHSHLAS